MKTLAAVLVLVAAVSSFGAVVTFTPVGSASVLQGTPVVYTVGLSGSGTFYGLDAILSTNSTGALSWTFSPALPSIYNSKTDKGNLSKPGAFANQKYLSVVNSSTADEGAVQGLVLGTLTIQTPAQGQFTLKVDGNADGISALQSLPPGELDPVADVLTGSATFNVTPEPATMALLALGGLLVARRRHA